MFQTFCAEIISDTTHSDNQLVVWNIDQRLFIYFVLRLNVAVPLIRDHFNFQQTTRILSQL